MPDLGHASRPSDEGRRRQGAAPIAKASRLIAQRRHATPGGVAGFTLLAHNRPRQHREAQPHSSCKDGKAGSSDNNNNINTPTFPYLHTYTHPFSKHPPAVFHPSSTFPIYFLAISRHFAMSPSPPARTQARARKHTCGHARALTHARTHTQAHACTHACAGPRACAHTHARLHGPFAAQFACQNQTFSSVFCSKSSHFHVFSCVSRLQQDAGVEGSPQQHPQHHQHHRHHRGRTADLQAQGCRPKNKPKNAPEQKQMMQVMLITFLFTHPRHAQGRRRVAAAPGRGRPFLTYFFGWEGCPTKIHEIEKCWYPNILSSLLQDLAIKIGWATPSFKRV